MYPLYYNSCISFFSKMQNESTNQKKEFDLYEMIRFIVIALVIVVPIRLYIAKPFIVSGESMDPTFRNGDYLIIDQISYRVGEPERGDVVIFRYPKDTTKFFIKRIVGLPGETVHFEEGRISISNEGHPRGIVLQEPYLTHHSFETFTTKMGPNEYFVLGDNRPESSDSRFWGPLKAEFIVGRPFARLFPPTSISIFPGEYQSATSNE